eukprot:g79900.t1
MCVPTDHENLFDCGRVILTILCGALGWVLKRFLEVLLTFYISVSNDQAGLRNQKKETSRDRPMYLCRYLQVPVCILFTNNA